MNSHSEKETQTADPLENRPLSGVRVLLTEDNRINSEVASAILIDAGAEVDVAENGADAVKAVKVNEYDVILMDVQMPRMDGYEATRLIRASVPESRRPPIIAMTAHTLTKDRRECTDAGMDDFISKPIDPDLVIDVILKWVGKKPGSFFPKTSPSDMKTDPLPGIDMEKAISRVRGNKSLYIRLLKSFETEAALIFSEIRDASSAGRDDDFVKQRIHRLKGSSGNLSLYRVHLSAGRIEEKGPVDELMQELEAALVEVSLSIDLLGEAGEEAGEAHEANPEHICEMFRELSGLLADHNLRAQPLAEKLIRSLSARDSDGVLSELEMKISLFDFKEARKVLHRAADQLGIPWEE